MKQIINDVLTDMSDSQINLASEAARETVTSLISVALKTKGTYKEYTEYELDEQKARASWICSICGENTFEVDSDYIGTGTNHLFCDLEVEMKSDKRAERRAYGPLASNDRRAGDRREKNYLQKKHEEKVFPGVDAIQKQAYTEMTSDGLPEGGDAQAVLESHKLAEEIVKAQEGTWIYESPDGGKTLFRRPFADYDPEKKEEINWKTKEPTGRTFHEYPFEEIER